MEETYSFYKLKQLEFELERDLEEIESLPYKEISFTTVKACSKEVNDNIRTHNMLLDLKRLLENLKTIHNIKFA
jgi:hypothetical protein